VPYHRKVGHIALFSPTVHCILPQVSGSGHLVSSTSQFIHDLISLRPIENHIQRKTFVGQLTGKSGNEIGIGVTNDQTVSIIDNTIIVQIGPYHISSPKHFSSSCSSPVLTFCTVGCEVYIALVPVINTECLMSIKDTYWLTDPAQRIFID